MVPALAAAALPLAWWAAVQVVAVPPDTKCPAPDALAAALAARVPDDGIPWRALYIVRRPTAPAATNAVHFELYDRRGRLRVRRE